MVPALALTASGRNEATATHIVRCNYDCFTCAFDGDAIIAFFDEMMD